MLKDEQPVYIQTHNFPDHDAVASANALGFLLEQQGIPCTLIYEGIIQDILKGIENGSCSRPR